MASPPVEQAFPRPVNTEPCWPPRVGNTIVFVVLFGVCDAHRCLAAVAHRDNQRFRCLIDLDQTFIDDRPFELYDRLLVDPEFEVVAVAYRQRFRVKKRQLGNAQCQRFLNAPNRERQSIVCRRRDKVPPSPKRSMFALVIQSPMIRSS